MEVRVDNESKLTLHGLVQHYVTLHEQEKNKKLVDLLDALDFNQVRQGRADEWVDGSVHGRTGRGCWVGGAERGVQQELGKQ